MVGNSSVISATPAVCGTVNVRVNQKSRQQYVAQNLSSQKVITIPHPQAEPGDFVSTVGPVEIRIIGLEEPHHRFPS